MAHRVRENAWYAGALEYVSPNPWGELKDEEREGRRGQKGWLLVELGTGTNVEFRPVPLARQVIDLEPIEGAGLPADRLDALLCERISGLSGGIEEQVVRQLVWNVPRYVARDLDHARVRELKEREKELKQRDRTLVLFKADLEEREKEVAARERNVGVVEHNLAQQLMQIAKPELPAKPRRKLGRNELCWCKSGKKYKNCHLPLES